jgi:hypothetical protein
MSLAVLCRSLTALGLAATTLAGQNVTIDNTFNLPFGSSDLGGKVTVTAFASFGAIPLGTRAEIGGRATARVKMFGVDVEAASATLTYTASARVLNTRPVASSLRSFKVKLVGIEVINDSDGQAVGALPPLEVFGPTGLAMPIPVGPVVITVSANAGITSEFNISGSADGQTRTVSVTGSVNAAANGVARAGIGVPGVQVGISATLKFADTTATLTLGASPSGPTGSFRVDVRAIRLLLALFAEIPLVPRLSYTFYEYSRPPSGPWLPLN